LSTPKREMRRVLKRSSEKTVVFVILPGTPDWAIILPRVKLYITSKQRAEIVAHVQSGLPQETCGLLWGRDGRALVHRPADNVARSPTRYEMDPIWQVAVMHEMLARGLELVAIYHSHPEGPSVPSTTDVARAYYPDSAYIVLSPGPDREWTMKAYRIVEGQVSAIEILVAGAGDAI